MEKETYVPKEIGICVDGYGFLGMLDLRTFRRRYGVTEYFGLTKDPSSKTYLADYYTNENAAGDRFRLEAAEEPHPGGLYYVSDSGGLDGIGSMESYVLYLDDETFCRLETEGSGSRLPEVRTGTKGWAAYYEVVKAPVKRIF